MEVRRDEVAVRVTGRRQRLLLALLTASVGQTVPVSHIIDALWDEREEPADPVNTVQQYVGHLRRALGTLGAGPRTQQVIVTSAPGYRLELAPTESDVGEFGAHLRRARSRLDQGDRSAAADTAAQALDLWRGAPFVEFADRPSLRHEIDRLERERLAAAEIYSLARLRDRRYSEVVDLLAVNRSWWIERTQLAAAYCAALAHLDRQADALTAAEEHRANLAERGLEPSVGFTQIVNDIAALGRPRTHEPDTVLLGAGGDHALRRLLTVLPTLQDDDPADARGVDYHLAIAQAMNVPTMSTDVVTWLGELQRHQPGFARALEFAVREAPERGLELALELARFWDWTGQHSVLRHRLEQLLRALQSAAHPGRAEASSWLAFSYAEIEPDTAQRHLTDALHAAHDDPMQLGRTRAVESVIRRPVDPEQARVAAEAAVELLRRHGRPDEAAYAHIVSSLAALAVHDLAGASLEVGHAATLYSEIGDPRGLAWVEIIQARLDAREPIAAAAFGQTHDDRPTARMLREEGGR
jgi:DNA-binding SARP family transcriptional activator